MGKFIDLTGQKFGRLIVVEKAEKPKNVKNKETYWKCYCDCGNKKIINGRSIRTGHSTSCGCFNIENKKNIDKLKKIGFNNRKGVITLYNQVYWHTYNNAKKRNLFFDIDKKFCYQICSKPCFFCNQLDKRRNKDTGEFFNCNGIDRINNQIGYTKENCVPCCFICNRAKNTLSEEKFLSWIEQVYKHSIENNTIKESV